MSHRAFNYAKVCYIYSCMLFASVCFLFSSLFYVGFMVNTQFMHDLNLFLETKSFVSSLALS